MGQAIRNQPLTTEAWALPTPVHVTFVVQKVALGQLLAEYFSFLCQYCFTSVPHLFIHLLLTLYNLSNG
jgi:hypothetical protein